jgi:hypothetical protein
MFVCPKAAKGRVAENFIHFLLVVFFAQCLKAGDDIE